MIKNIIVFLILVMFLIIQKYILQKNIIEKFECLFIPWGTSLNSCIDLCNSSYKKKDKGGWNTSDDISNPSCNINKCSEICNGCSVKQRCQWLNTYGNDKYKITDTYDANMEPIDNTIELYNIGQTDIERGLDRINDDSIIIKWKRFSNKDKGNVDYSGNYIVHFYLYSKDGKLEDSVKHIKIIKTTNNMLVFNKNIKLDQEGYQYDDSSNNSYYLSYNSAFKFIVYELNNTEVIGKSNTINVNTPSGYL